MDDLEILRYIDRTIADLKGLLDDRYAAQQKAIDAALAATDKALTKAELSLDKRFDAINVRLAKLERQHIEFKTSA